MHKKKLFTIVFFAILLITAFVILAPKKATSPHINSTTAQFNKKQHSLDDPSSIWVVVNKKRPLSPATFAPSDLVAPSIPLRLNANNPEMQVRQVTADALKTMNDQAKKDNITFMLASGYRSYALQVSVYGSNVKQLGISGADSQSARPGYSEHQTGLAADLEPVSHKCEVEDCFATTPEGQWLAAHAYEYGFVIRYQKDAQPTTGYKYEPWHVRYVGTELAKQIHTTNMPLETFFGLPVAPTY